jgi:hypothetical protein
MIPLKFDSNYDAFHGVFTFHNEFGSALFGLDLPRWHNTYICKLLDNDKLDIGFHLAANGASKLAHLVKTVSSYYIIKNPETTV